MKNLAYDDLAEMPDWQDLLSELECGPGASLGSKGRNTALEKLFFNPMTTTSAVLYREYRRFLRQNTAWLAAEMLRVHKCGDDALTVVRGSRLTHVRKNSEIDRTINVEASLNMLFQKALAEHFNQVLRARFRYSKKVQPLRNRRMARRASFDGKSATVDLTSASDLNSMLMFMYIFPPAVYGAMMDCRSQRVEIDGEYHHLHMMSCMGNGFTFPVMTYVFSLMLLAIAELEGFDPREVSFAREQFGVFGDDIICPTELYPKVVEILAALGHSPNEAKSFHTGSFRESCGSDCYKGDDVRGVYAKTLRSRPEMYSLINRLNRWSARWQVPLPTTIALILPKKWRRHLVPIDEMDDAGVKVPYDMYREVHAKARWLRCIRTRKKVLRLFNREGQLLPMWASNLIGVYLLATIGWIDSKGVTRRQVGNLPKRYDEVRLPIPDTTWDRYDVLTSYNVTIRDWRAYTAINLTD
jgi:hypothetical protein